MGETSFALGKFMWQILNFGILLLIIGFIIYIPKKIFEKFNSIDEKVNSIEKNVAEINHKFKDQELK